MSCPDLGTRARQGFRKERATQGSDTRSHTRDVGMSKRTVTSVTFTAATGRATGATGDFSAFAAGDPVLIQGARLNNGFYEVTGIDATNHAYLVLDPHPKDEGPVANVIVRTP